MAMVRVIISEPRFKLSSRLISKRGWGEGISSIQFLGALLSVMDNETVEKIKRDQSLASTNFCILDKGGLPLVSGKILKMRKYTSTENAQEENKIKETSKKYYSINEIQEWCRSGSTHALKGVELPGQYYQMHKSRIDPYRLEYLYKDENFDCFDVGALMYVRDDVVEEVKEAATRLFKVHGFGADTTTGAGVGEVEVKEIDEQKLWGEEQGNHILLLGDAIPKDENTRVIGQVDRYTAVKNAPLKTYAFNYICKNSIVQSNSNTYGKYLEQNEKLVFPGKTIGVPIRWDE